MKTLDNLIEELYYLNNPFDDKPQSRTIVEVLNELDMTYPNWLREYKKYVMAKDKI